MLVSAVCADINCHDFGVNSHANIFDVGETVAIEANRRRLNFKENFVPKRKTSLKAELNFYYISALIKTIRVIREFTVLLLLHRLIRPPRASEI